MSERCAFCKKDPAEGFAEINGDRYCHGDEKPSCYVLAISGTAVSLFGVPWQVVESSPNMVRLRPVRGVESAREAMRRAGE